MNFISYSRKDSASATLVAQILRASGQEVFVDVNSLRHGADYTQQIADTIARSERLFLIWSVSAAASREVAAEWRQALANPACRIIPVPIDSTPLPQEIAQLHGVAELDQLIQIVGSKDRGALWQVRGLWFAAGTAGLLVILWGIAAGVRTVWPAATTVVNELPRALWLLWQHGPLKSLLAASLAAVCMHRLLLSWKLRRAQRNAIDAVFVPVTGTAAGVHPPSAPADTPNDEDDNEGLTFEAE